MIPVDYVLSVGVPGIASWLVLKLIAVIRFRNLFVYMLGGGFFGAMAAVQMIGLTSLLLFFLCAEEELLQITLEHYLLFFLLMFPEGFINGSVMTMLTVYCPDLVKTYDDHIYLDDQ